jgi:ribonuclease P protein component
MNTNRDTFPKNERLSWKRHIDLLFQKGASFVVFPLRVIYLSVDKNDSDASVSMLVSVSKKRLKHAVDRNYVKRRIRESYRLQKYDLIHLYTEKNKMLLLAFLYLDHAKSSYEKIDRAMTKVIHIIQKQPE